jgi:hypothetical protein
LPLYEAAGVFKGPALGSGPAARRATRIGASKPGEDELRKSLIQTRALKLRQFAWTDYDIATVCYL